MFAALRNDQRPPALPHNNGRAVFNAEKKDLLEGSTETTLTTDHETALTLLKPHS